MKLEQISIERKAIILDLLFNDEDKKRFMELGVIIGEQIQIIRKGSFHGPFIVFCLGNQIMIRRVDAACIIVKYDE